MPDRMEVYAAIDSERLYQDSRWPNHSHEPEAYVVYIEDYLAELKHLIARNDADRVRERAMGLMRKITALGVACMEEHGAPPRE